MNEVLSFGGEMVNVKFSKVIKPLAAINRCEKFKLLINVE